MNAKLISFARGNHHRTPIELDGLGEGSSRVSPINVDDILGDNWSLPIDIEDLGDMSAQVSTLSINASKRSLSNRINHALTQRAVQDLGSVDLTLDSDDENTLVTRSVRSGSAQTLSSQQSSSKRTSKPGSITIDDNEDDVIIVDPPVPRPTSESRKRRRTRTPSGTPVSKRPKRPRESQSQPIEHGSSMIVDDQGPSTRVPMEPSHPIHTSEHSDSDSDSAFLGISDESKWLELPVTEAIANLSLRAADENLTTYTHIIPAPLKSFAVPSTSSRPLPNPNATLSPLYIWGNKGYKGCAKSARYVPKRRFGKEPAGFSPYELKTSYSVASGSINKVVQKDGWVAACASAIDGTPDYHQIVPPGHYNSSGTVTLWNEGVNGGAPLILSPHCRLKRTLRPGEKEREEDMKHYTVNDIKVSPAAADNDFDTDAPWFITSGNDKKVRIWTFNAAEHHHQMEGEKKMSEQLFNTKTSWDRRSRVYTLHGPGRDIEICPGTTVFAVASTNLHIFDVDDINYSETIMTAQNTCIGAFAWGRPQSKSENHLYISSETHNFRTPTVHSVYKLVSGQPLLDYDFQDARGSSDCLCIDNRGETVALATFEMEKVEDEEAQLHRLRLYDVRRQAPRSKSTTSIPSSGTHPNDSDLSTEVHCMSFSPDSLYLALGMNDNRTIIYDTRMMSQPLNIFPHEGPTHVRDKHYGVTQLQWTHVSHRNGLRLVSGSNDACVRLWDPDVAYKSSGNGKTVVSAKSDVTYFQMGNGTGDVYDLVTGDVDGEIGVYNSTRPIIADFNV